MREALENPSSIEHLHGAARRDDGLARSRAERVRPDREGVRQRAFAQALEPPALAHEAVRPQLVRPDDSAGGERRELADVEHQVRRARERAEATLREPALERHLAALVARGAVAARARAAALVAAPGRLAVARARPATDALAPPGGPGRGLEVTEVHAVSPPSRPGARPSRACRGRPASPSGSPTCRRG